MMYGWSKVRYHLNVWVELVQELMMNGCET